MMTIINIILVIRVLVMVTMMLMNKVIAITKSADINSDKNDDCDK